VVEPWGLGQQEIIQSEHIDPKKTGDNIQAKRVALYVDDGTFSGNWTRMTQPGSTSGPTDSFPATQNITAQDTSTATVAGYQGQTFIIGTPTANSAATFPLSSISTVNIQTTGLWTGSLRIEASMDGGTTYVSKFSRLPGTSYSGAATVTLNAFLIAAVSGCTHIRVRSIAAWTGTAVIKISSTVNDHLTDVLNPIRLLDATTNTQATIKAASTAPAATDTSIVTSLNPNSTLPAGTNVIGHVIADTGSTTAVTGTVSNRPAPSSTSALTTVTSSATSVTLLAANTNRRMMFCYNSSTSDAYVKFGTTASSTSFTLYLPSLGNFSINGEDYAGRIDIIWLSANGNAYVTETTA
jgi:hypothetical protein